MKTAKNFRQMTTKKLNALMATVNEQEQMEIKAILEERGALAAVEETAVEETAVEETAVEETAVEETAVEETAVEETAVKAQKKQKMTDEERHALAEQLKANINHKCQAVPFNTIEWVDGVITGVIEEKRSNKVLYAIKTEDGRRIIKVHDSNLVKVFDEVVEPEKRVRSSRKSAEKIEWSEEAISEGISSVIENVGKKVEIEKYRSVDENGKENIEIAIGRIVAIVPDRRSQKLLYRISIPTPVEGNPLAVKTMYKVVTAPGFVIVEEMDELGQEMNLKYRDRRAAAVARTPLTPQDRFLKCEENLAKAEEKLKKAEEEVEAKKLQLEAAKKELDEYLASQSTDTQTEETEEESLA